MDNNSDVRVCLKRTLFFKSHVCFEPVRPRVIQGVLEFLELDSPFYKDIKININNLPLQLFSNIQNNEIATNIIEKKQSYTKYEEVTSTLNDNKEKRWLTLACL